LLDCEDEIDLAIGQLLEESGLVSRLDSISDFSRSLNTTSSKAAQD